MKPSKTAPDAKSFLDVYGEYNSALRNWFISLGVGGPAFLLVKNPFSDALLKSNQFKFVIMLFVFGVVIQIVVVFINKPVAWINYAVRDDEVKNKPSEFLKNLADKVSEMYWIDLTADFLTVILFTIAIATVLQLDIKSM